MHHPSSEPLPHVNTQCPHRLRTCHHSGSDAPQLHHSYTHHHTQCRVSASPAAGGHVRAAVVAKEVEQWMWLTGPYNPRSPGCGEESPPHPHILGSSCRSVVWGRRSPLADERIVMVPTTWPPTPLYAAVVHTLLTQGSTRATTCTDFQPKRRPHYPHSGIKKRAVTTLARVSI